MNNTVKDTSLSEEMLIGSVQEYMQAFCRDFFLGCGYSSKELEKFYIAGGTFSNLYHFLKNSNQPNRWSYMQMYPDTDIDLYVDVSTAEEYEALTSKLLNFYGGSVLKAGANVSLGNSNYITKSHHIATPFTEWNPNEQQDQMYPLVKQVQLISIQFGPAEQVVETFDNEHGKVWYNVGKNELHYTQQQLDLIRNKSLKYYEELSEYPNKRITKFENRGWNVISTSRWDDDEIPF